ncbi:hypothetical protein ISN45_Aa06g029620 [Arabidopsis thaliana x Arabidopsis arenosa]|uniref:Uncharacterized protein n=1 Tax=Arabidopsis thaliana x Arabidopsis arenosa TaxID=1240361 RepID=A0A8T1Z275_9BRAS|nr:hypothetical protein ISN45_Aa06g029620 [Arabidopsis thaliana x Arabidopsis arenosa]
MFSLLRCFGDFLIASGDIHTGPEHSQSCLGDTFITTRCSSATSGTSYTIITPKPVSPRVQAIPLPRLEPEATSPVFPSQLRSCSRADFAHVPEPTSPVFPSRPHPCSEPTSPVFPSQLRPCPRAQIA